jgi:hypothetical protein
MTAERQRPAPFPPYLPEVIGSKNSLGLLGTAKAMLTFVKKWFVPAIFGLGGGLIRFQGSLLFPTCRLSPTLYVDTRASYSMVVPETRSSFTPADFQGPPNGGGIRPQALGSASGGPYRRATALYVRDFETDRERSAQLFSVEHDYSSTTPMEGLDPFDYNSCLVDHSFCFDKPVSDQALVLTSATETTTSNQIN